MLSAYYQQKQTELFNELGVFFAFSNAQFDEQKKEGVEYCTVLKCGDCVPKQNADQFLERLSALHKESRERNLAEMGIDAIIEYELSNHECWYTGDIKPAVEALEGYDVTYDQVKAIYNKLYDEKVESM